MSRGLLVPSSLFSRKADPLPPVFPRPEEGDIYLNTHRGVVRHYLGIFGQDGRWEDLEGMRWVPYTGPGQIFYVNDVSRDGAWTMVANKTTTDRPAPQPTGPVTDLLPAYVPTASSAKADYTVENTWTMSTAGWVERVGFDVHTSNVGMTHTLVALVNGSVVQTVAFSPTASQGGTVLWYQTYNQSPLAIGTQLTLRLTVTEPTTANRDRSWYQQAALFATPPAHCSAATGKKDGGASTTTAYGLHVEFKPGSKSPDWDVVAVSGLGGGINDIEALDARYDSRYVNVTGDTVAGELIVDSPQIPGLGGSIRAWTDPSASLMFRPRQSGAFISNARMFHSPQNSRWTVEGDHLITGNSMADVFQAPSDSGLWWPDANNAGIWANGSNVYIGNWNGTLDKTLNVAEVRLANGGGVYSSAANAALFFYNGALYAANTAWDTYIPLQVGGLIDGNSALNLNEGNARYLSRSGNVERYGDFMISNYPPYLSFHHPGVMIASIRSGASRDGYESLDLVNQAVSDYANWRFKHGYVQGYGIRYDAATGWGAPHMGAIRYSSGVVHVIIDNVVVGNISTSARSLKAAIAPLRDGEALPLVNRLRPVWYTPKRVLPLPSPAEPAHHSEGPEEIVQPKERDDEYRVRRLGLIADEVDRVIPGAASKNNKGEPGSVLYDSLVPLLIKAVQEQQNQIAALESRITALEAV